MYIYYILYIYDICQILIDRKKTVWICLGNSVGAFSSCSVCSLQAVGDLVTLFDLHAQEGDPGRGAVEQGLPQGLFFGGL